MTKDAIAAIACMIGLGIGQPAIAESVQDIWDGAIAAKSQGISRNSSFRPPLKFRPPLNLSMKSVDPEPYRSPTKAVRLGWGDLLPPHISSETPFAKLPKPLLEAMRTHVRWKTSKPRAREDADFIAAHELATTLLASHQIDVEGLMNQRRRIIAQNGRVARGPNAEILGKLIRLPGYVVPLSSAGQMVTEFLFVPVAGACVHTPTPAPNQIVHVTYPEGLVFTSIFDAFWIEGELSALDTNSDVVYFDGTAKVEAIYALRATAVGAYLR